MQESRLDAWQQFIGYEKQRTKMKLSAKLDALMDYCQYSLHTQFDKNTKGKQKHKKKRQELSQEYRQAFKTLNRDQKLAYYLRFMKLITTYLQGKDEGPPLSKGMFSTDVYSRSFNLKMWKHKKMRLDRQKHILYAQKDNKIKTYMLENYIIRKSKNKQYHCFVLQAINDHPHEKSRTVHLGFKEQVKFNQWFKQLQAVFNVIDWNYIVNQMKLGKMKSMTDSDFRGDIIASSRNQTIEHEQQQDKMSKSLLIQSTFSKKQELTSPFSPKQRKIKNPRKQSSQFDSENKQQFFSDSSEEDEPKPIKNGVLLKRQSITQAITKNDNFEQIESLVQNQQKKVITNEAKQDIFHRLMPAYNLDTLTSTMNYGVIFQQGKLRIMGHLQQNSKIKLFLQLPNQFSSKLVLNSLTNTEAIKDTNSEIQQISLKTLIKSENSAMMYLKIKAYNKLYRPRDFIFLRHVFRTHDHTYIIDKSIENLSFPPFTTIVRGQLCILWGIIKQAGKCSLVADLQIKNQGYLNDAQNVNLVLKFIKPFANLEKIILSQQARIQNCNLFSDGWNIVEEFIVQNDNGENKKIISAQSISNTQKEKQSAFKKKKDSTNSSSPNKQNTNQVIHLDEFKQLKGQKQFKQQQNKVIIEPKQLKQTKLKQKYSHMQEQRGQIDLNQVQDLEKLKNTTVHGIKRDFDKDGYVIISNSFVRTKYILTPLPKKQIIFQEAVKGHPIWKGEWIHDDKFGAIIFIDHKKIEDQKGVLKFILTKIGKNLLSGKSVLNISLPVDIFSAESNLQRLIYSLTYAPTHLQPAVKEKVPLQRFKKIIAFGVSNSPLYLNMQKPFNPILGQTFQCWIDGCPAYAQQISHHPPIAALFYEGRGFKMTAQLQSKVELHMNSGCGTNDGVFRIKFNDGMEVCYMTPGGEVSGLAYGDRKFNMVGKAYYWIQSENLFLQLVFNPTKKGFFSVGKQQQPIDYFQGTVCKIKPQFLQNFLKKKKTPTEKQITQKLGRVHGIWNKYVQYQDEVILNIDKQFPAKLEYEPNPLPSDANWREDIAYRRILQISRAQTQKQRLQVLQRKDRKLREANPNHSHHKK